MKKWVVILIIIAALSYCLYAQPGPIRPVLTNLTQFVNQTAWRLFYSNGDGDVTELAFGTSGQYLKSNGASSAPSWSAPAGGGDLLADGTVPLTANWDVGNFDITLKSLVGDGTVTATGGFVLSDGATITQSANNYITLAENSDNLQAYFDGTNVAVLWSDGVLKFRNQEDGVDGYVDICGKDAGEKGILRVLSASDDKAISFYHDDTDGQINTSSGDLYFTAEGGDINFNDDNLTTTGTLEAATITEGGVAVYNDNEIDEFSEIDAIVADKSLVNMADGATWLGVHTFGGATTVIPWKVNATAAPTVEGQAIWESDTDELTVGDGSASIVIAAKTNTVFCFNVHDIDSGMDDIKMPFTRATTITKVTAFVTGGTNVVGRLYEVDGDGDDADAVGVEAGDWTFTVGETEDTSFNNATFDAGDYIQWDTTSVSGSVTGFMISVEGYEI